MVAIILAVLLTFNCIAPVLACNEEQSNTYIMQLLFGNEAAIYQHNTDSEILLDGLYLCSIQSDKCGKEKISELKQSRVSGIPNLEKIDVSNTDLFACAHNRWDYISSDCRKEQEQRKNILRNSVVNVFDFGWFNETFKKDEGQIDSFAALLYYCHILADYLADDPIDTRIYAKGYDIPAYLGNPYYTLKRDRPKFTDDQKARIDSCKWYSPLDRLKRCGPATVIIGTDTLQSISPRGNISNIKPTGWHQTSYETIMPVQEQLFNRCHLVAHSLGGDDTEENLITGTGYLNVAMKKYETKVLSYINNTGNSVLYRATPVFVGQNLLASGVQLEAYSLKDKGKGLSFNVYCYNVQPGVDIDYVNGGSEMVDNMVTANRTIPFAVNGADGSNPDLMFEIKETLGKLFSSQHDNNDYTLMIQRLDDIAREARNVKGEKDWEIYKNMKPLQHAYMETLTEYVPKLLQNEDFFREVFQ